MGQYLIEMLTNSRRLLRLVSRSRLSPFRSQLVKNFSKKQEISYTTELNAKLTPFLNFSDKKNNDNKNKKKKDWKFGFDPKKFNNMDPKYTAAILIGLGGIVYLTEEQVREALGLYPRIEFTELVSKVRGNEVERIKIQKYVGANGIEYQAVVVLNTGAKNIICVGNVDSFTEKIEKSQNQEGFMSDHLIPMEFEVRTAPMKMLTVGASLLSTLVLIGFFGTMLYNTRKMDLGGGGMGGAMDFKKTQAKQFTVEAGVGVRFKDVAGLDQAKLEITEFVDFLKKPEKYKELGAKIPRGALLSGPPGTGKTMLAKACAGEAGVTFLYCSGSEFVEMFVGVGASRVRDLFKTAKENAPAIIFVDEIDAIGKKRENSMSSGTDERDSTLNQLLVELDGFGTDTEVVVFAATNRKELLDNALTRTGRFDRSVEITLPDIDSRKEIFQVHLSPLKLSDERTIEKYANRLATLTPGFSGADIANICNEAAILAARENGKHVTPLNFELAVERVIGGLEQKRVVSEEERKTVAVHESGHAVVSWFLEGGDPLLKVSSLIDFLADYYPKVKRIFGLRPIFTQ